MNKQSIITALEYGCKVCWKNNAYKVILQNGELYEVYKYNDSMCRLNESQYNDCYIGA